MISSSLIKKWKKMIKNDSVFHVNQTTGKYYTVDGISGYYNNLMDKVKYTKTIDENGIPYNIAAYGENKKKIYFPITIFQYGLGAYDLYLETNDSVYRQMMLNIADWAVSNQMYDGSWDAFGPLNYDCIVSSMAQGEAASLLARAFLETNDGKYKHSCQKAVDFMIKDKADGGTAEYQEEGLILLEYPHKAAVLNGWIFSAFGLLDAWKITGEQKYYDNWNNTVNCIKSNIRHFNAFHWSYYDMGGKYTSPFYHKLHIELLKALNTLAPDEVFQKFIDQWTEDYNNRVWKGIAFFNKARQKVLEKKSNEWVLAE